MAARQDQSQVVGLIICAIMIVVLGGLSYWFYTEWNKADARAKELTSQKSNSDNAAREAIVNAETYLEMMGFDKSTPFADVKRQFEGEENSPGDRQRFMSNFDEANQNYRAVLETIYAENTAIAQQESEAKAREKSIRAELVAMKQQYDAQVEEFRKARDKALADLASERLNFKESLEALEARQADQARALARNETQFKSQVAAANSERDMAVQNLVDAERQRDRLQYIKDSIERASFEVADGLITYANQAKGTVWINLGDGDDLRRQVTFSVFESDLRDAGKADKKGSIEVTRIIDEHLAEARITNDDPTNPILPGDQIYSQLWERGQKLRFALTGVIDLDGDGQSDLQQAKDLIALNGAVVDSSLEEDGTIDGSMSEYTRYLVLGENPTAPSKAAIRKGFQDMSTEAAKWSVETISLAEFLAHIGYRHTESSTDTGKTRRPRSGGRPTSYRFGTP